MGKTIDDFYHLTKEEEYYKTLYGKKESSPDLIMLPSTQGKNKIILSSSIYSDREESVIMLKHPVYMPRYTHSHKFVELTYIYSGAVIENIEGDGISLKKGEAIILFPGFFHDIWTDDEDTIALNFLIDADLFHALDERFSLSISKCAYALYSTLDITKEIEMILKEEDVKDGLSKEAKEIALELIMLKLKREAVLLKSVEKGKRKDYFKIIGYIEENIEDITLSKMAEDFSISEQYASRLIKEKTGETFSTIVRRLKMEAAVAMLKKDNKNISEIALSLGFSKEHFCRLFKSYYGTSATEWMKNSI